MKPSSRFLLGGLLVTLALGTGAGYFVLRTVAQSSQAEAQQRLQVAGTVESELQASRLQELQLRAEVLSHDVAFVDYVAQSLIPTAALGGAVDSASISDLLTERRKGYDIASVLDPRGKLVATSGILLRASADVQHDPLVTRAIATLKPAQGAWVDHGKLLWVAVNPLLRGGALQGVLLTATRVDEAFAIAVSRIARTPVAFAIQPSPGAPLPPSSGVDGWVSQALAAQREQILAIGSPQVLRVVDARHEVSAWVTPLQVAGSRAALVAVDDRVDEGTGLIPTPAQPLLLGVGLITLLALLWVVLQWQRTMRPLQQLLELIERAADTGDQNLTVRVSGSAIVRELRDGINRLLRR